MVESWPTARTRTWFGCLFIQEIELYLLQLLVWVSVDLGSVLVVLMSITWSAGLATCGCCLLLLFGLDQLTILACLLIWFNELLLFLWRTVGMMVVSSSGFWDWAVWYIARSSCAQASLFYLGQFTVLLPPSCVCVCVCLVSMLLANLCYGWIRSVRCWYYPVPNFIFTATCICWFGCD